MQNGDGGDGGTVVRGRKLSFKVVLTPAEREQLEHLCRMTTAPAGLVGRARIILELGAGRTEAEVARRCDCEEKTVRKWGRRYERDRLLGLADLPRPGRPRSFPPSSGAGGRRDRLPVAI